MPKDLDMDDEPTVKNAIADEPTADQPPKVAEPAVKAAVKAEIANGASKKDWNRDKHGNLLSGKAMYQRFYRSIRSPFDSNYRSHVCAN